MNERHEAMREVLGIIRDVANGHGNTPLGAPNSMMRQAQEVGLELRAARAVVAAAQFAVDFADDDGSCVVCDYPLAASEPGDLFCDDDCPGHKLRVAVVACNALIGAKKGSSHDAEGLELIKKGVKGK